mgnify:CR=1 FL=1
MSGIFRSPVRVVRGLRDGEEWHLEMVLADTVSIRIRLLADESIVVEGAQLPESLHRPVLAAARAWVSAEQRSA